MPDKNTRPFADYSFGLIEIKLKQLLQVNTIDEIILSTNDQQIIDFAKSIASTKLNIHHRTEYLSSSDTSTDQLITHVLDLITDAHILWTHVTSPFVTAQDYQKLIDVYFDGLERGYDSLMTTTLIHGFLWDEQRPVNYDRTVEKWPRTQTLKPLHEINSAVFLSHSDNYRLFNDRIGHNPLLCPLDKIKSFDIDWLDDFYIAECIAKASLVEI